MKRWRRIARKPWSPFLLVPVLYLVFWIWMPDVVAAILAVIFALIVIIFRLTLANWLSR